MRNLFLLLSLCSLSAYAQFPMGGPPSGNRPPAAIPGTANDNAPRGNGKITGTLVDSTSSKPVEFATVALIDPKTKKPIDGTTTDDKGRFTLSKLANGEYRVQFTFIGYRVKEVGPVTIQRGADINLGNVTISPDIRTLQEVTVTGQAAMVEEKVDRIVYNAEKDITNRGGDATDVMRKVPMLSVDLDGNVSLRGSQNVLVLINNKPSTIVASSVADALKQIPADMIKSVEVITSPSAKYDAEGSAGIINIITKKNTLQGATLNVDAGVGNRGANLGLNGSLRTGKMGFNLGGFGRANYNVRGAFENEQRTQQRGIPTTTLQTSNTLNRGLFGQYNLSWDYDISKNSALTASLRFGLRNGNTFQDNLLTRTFTNNALSFVGSRDVNIDDFSRTVDANVSYTRTYKPQQEFTASGQYSRNNRTNNFIADILNGTDYETITSRQKNDNRSYNQETTIQLDYQTPIKSNQQLEYGAKGIFRQVQSNFKYLFTNGNNDNFQEDQRRPANVLDYDQNITSAYASYTYSTKNKYTVKAGARYEYTFINAAFQREVGGAPLDIPDYGNLVPSINISKTLKKGKTLKLAYNRRLQRPGIQFLNPNVNAANSLNITEGNPLLRPELTDNFEFSTSGSIKAFYVNATLFARLTSNSITSVRDTITQSAGNVANPVLQQAIRTTYLNIGQENAYGANIFANATLFSKWQIGGGFDVYNAFLTNNSPNPIYRASNSGWVVSGRLFTNLTVKNGWGVSGFVFARGRQVQLQGEQGGFAFYSFGVKKDFNNKRGSFGLAGENFLNNPFRVRSEFTSPILSQNSVTSLYNAGVRFNFSYRFGKMSFDQPRRRRSVTNDDVKDGEGGGDGGGQQQQAPAQGRPRN
ncbi:TonB-dependent receptor domain-containing protein [Tellurirhabdus rosea]|uniref:TonB-dependent receptor domain-containing protein n=1 Tax=Tellurirhabdus rosea TaxID=2674997 RepID=UPI00225AF43D|nr:TonB-dependent receptor [Tellurirhabdus rosea]